MYAVTESRSPVDKSWKKKKKKKRPAGRNR